MIVSCLPKLRRSALLLVIFGLTLCSAGSASAELTTISGFSFIGNHPVLGNVGMNAPGLFGTDGNGLTPVSVDLKFSFVGYATAADPIIVENPLLTFANGNIQFQIAPATHTSENLGGILGGNIFSEIIGASTTVPGLDVSKFVGGEFAFTYQNAQIQPGLSQAGASGLLTLGSVSTSSFTFVFRAVPEPGSVVLSLLSLSALGLVVWRKYPRTAAA